MTARAAVLAPAPVLTITVEQDANGADEIHAHVGGQGFWIAQLLAELGLDVVLCATCGGETGTLVRSMLEAHRIDVRAVDVAAANGAYVHDRRSGEREPVAETPAGVLSRHEADDYYGAALVEALEADVCVLGGGPVEPMVVPPEFYGRLAADVRRAGKLVTVDLSGEAMTAALAGGVSFAKLAHDEAVADGRAASEGEADLVAAMRDIAAAGTELVVVTRADQPALALVDGKVVTVVPPAVEAFEHRGAGDSLTAGVTAGLATGRDPIEALRVGAAAGALNVTRRGLGTGTRSDIERMAGLVEVRPLRPR